MSIVPKKDPRIDSYIAKAAEFAQPILIHVRQMIHAACPEVEETIKWGMPMFVYRGNLCHVAAFKQHCAFGFWHSGMKHADRESKSEAMGQFGRIGSVKDLPSKKEFSRLVKQAMKLNESGVKAYTRPKPKKKPAVKVPADLQVALKKNKRALKQFSELAPGYRREYLEWIEEAKRDETRQKRIATTVAWVAEGKSRNWKYQSC